MTSHLNQEESFFFQVGADGKKIRLDRFLADQLRSQGISREKIKGLNRDGRSTEDAVAAPPAPREVAPGERI